MACTARLYLVDAVPHGQHELGLLLVQRRHLEWACLLATAIGSSITETPTQTDGAGKRVTHRGERQQVSAVLALDSHYLVRSGMSSSLSVLLHSM